MGVLIALGLTELRTHRHPCGSRWGPGWRGWGCWGHGSRRSRRTSRVGSEWATTATGAPLLVTWVAAPYIALRAKRARGSRRCRPPGAGTGAARGCRHPHIVHGQQRRRLGDDQRGAHLVVERRPTGDGDQGAPLVAGVWLLQTAALRWWRSGRGGRVEPAARLGVVLTAGRGQWAVLPHQFHGCRLAVGLLYPLAGTLALFGIAGRRSRSA